MLAGTSLVSSRAWMATALVLNSKIVSGSAGTISSMRAAPGADLLISQRIAQLAAADAHFLVSGQEFPQFGFQVGPIRVKHGLVLVFQVGLQDAVAAIVRAAGVQVEVEIAARDGSGRAGAMFDKSAFMRRFGRRH